MAFPETLTFCLRLFFDSFMVAPEIACPICSRAAVFKIFSVEVALKAVGKTRDSLGER